MIDEIQGMDDYIDKIKNNTYWEFLKYTLKNNNESYDFWFIIISF